jgi:uncharacterized DUF497 family protein
MKHGFQTRDAEMDLGAMLPVLVPESRHSQARSKRVLIGDAT